VATDEGNGTLYWVVTASATPPSGAQVAAGQDHTGAAAADSGNQAVASSGTQNIAGGASGLTAATTYWAHFVQDDAATNRSDVSSSASFDTEAPPADVFAFGSGAVLKRRKELARDDQERDARWRKRREQVERIGRLVDGITADLPADTPEVIEAEAAIEVAAEKLAAPPPVFDHAALAASIKKAQAALAQAKLALARHEARKRREMEEQDDEDVLLLMA
jgi:hypothetical protein